MSDSTPPANPYATTVEPMSPSDEKLWATLIHVGGILFFAFIGFLIVPATYVLRIIFSILGFLKAKDGIPYRYPFALRLVK